jgi:hypothetical protein
MPKTDGSTMVRDDATKVSSLERLYLLVFGRLLFADDVLGDALPCMFKAKSARWSVDRGDVASRELRDCQYQTNSTD